MMGRRRVGLFLEEEILRREDRIPRGGFVWLIFTACREAPFYYRCINEVHRGFTWIDTQLRRVATTTPRVPPAHIYFPYFVQSSCSITHTHKSRCRAEFLGSTSVCLVLVDTSAFEQHQKKLTTGCPSLRTGLICRGVGTSRSTSSQCSSALIQPSS